MDCPRLATPQRPLPTQPTRLRLVSALLLSQLLSSHHPRRLALELRVARSSLGLGHSTRLPSCQALQLLTLRSRTEVRLVEMTSSSLTRMKVRHTKTRLSRPGPDQTRGLSSPPQHNDAQSHLHSKLSPTAATSEFDGRPAQPQAVPPAFREQIERETQEGWRRSRETRLGERWK